MKILFMGTPDFSRVCLEALFYSSHDIVGVVTTPDKPKGRGMELSQSEVKKFATEKNLRLYQPNTLKNDSFKATLEELNPDIIVVVAYGKILPEYILNYPKYGCINAHASILPKYRGAAPIQRAIIDGESETGVSVMRMDEGLDTGDVILCNKISIEQDDDFESVHDKLAIASKESLLEAIELIESGKAKYTKQDGNFTYAEKIEKNDCFIDFETSATNVHNRVRGLSPYPLSFTYLPNGDILKIVKTHVSNEKSDSCVGEVIKLDSFIHVQCKDGVIAIEELIPQGKGKMKSKDYINGRKINLGDILGK